MHKRRTAEDSAEIVRVLPNTRRHARSAPRRGASLKARHELPKETHRSRAALFYERVCPDADNVQTCGGYTGWLVPLDPRSIDDEELVELRHVTSSSNGRGRLGLEGFARLQTRVIRAASRIDLVQATATCPKGRRCSRRLRVIAEDAAATSARTSSVRRRAGANKSPSNCSLKKPAAPRVAPSTEMAPDKGQQR